MEAEKLLSIYIDCASWDNPVKPDDFIVAIGKKQTNSVYHVVESTPKPREHLRMIRYNLKVLRSDLITALLRDSDQQLITLYWYPRKKKS